MTDRPREYMMEALGIPNFYVKGIIPGEPPEVR